MVGLAFGNASGGRLAHPAQNALISSQTIVVLEVFIVRELASFAFIVDMKWAVDVDGDRLIRGDKDRIEFLGSPGRQPLGERISSRCDTLTQNEFPNFPADKRFLDSHWVLLNRGVRVREGFCSASAGIHAKLG